MQHEVRTGPTHYLPNALFALAFFALTLRVGSAPVGDSLDPSWTLVLSWAFENGSQWGSDIAFTHGPLGFLHPLASFYPSTFSRFLVGQLLLTAAGAFIATALFSRVSRIGQIVFCIFLYLFQSVLWADTLWVVLLICALLGFQLKIKHGGSARSLLVPIAVAACYASATSLIKVSMFPLAILWWMATCAISFRLSTRLLAGAALLFPSIWLGLWTLSGQHLGALPEFMAATAEMIGHYASAMSAGAAIPVEFGGMVILLATAGLLAGSLWRARADGSWLAVIGYLMCALLFAWKAGFTRADAHTMTFFGVAAWIAAITPFVVTPRHRRVPIAGYLLLSLCCLPLMIVGSSGALSLPLMLTAAPTQAASIVKFLLAPGDLHVAREADWQAQAQRLALPRIRAATGDATVDMLGNQQGVIFLNGLNYHPRPAFQSYLAFSPRLAKLNELFYTNTDAPHFIIFATAPIDGHLPASEDALSFLVLLRDYVPVTIESSYLLLKRRGTPHPPSSTPEPVASWEAGSLGEWIDIAPPLQRGCTLGVQASLTPAGSLASLLLREPSWFIELQLDDGSVERHRFVRGAVETGFLLSPLVRSVDEMASLYAGAGLPLVKRFRLQPATDRLAPLFANKFRYSLRSAILPAVSR